MDVVLLRFDAPLMSFGSVVVDHHNKTDPLPYRAMLTGLLANALGLTRRDEAELTALQTRVRYAARRDRKGAALVDYQTVDFDSAGPMASDLGWTTRGTLEERKGGKEASEGTHIRYRHYLADAIVTVALTLDPAGHDPSLRAVSEALRAPARPLFLGRKCCIPSGPIWLGETEAPSLRQALVQTPRAGGLRPGDAPRSDTGELQAVWPQTEGGDENETRLWPRVEDRDMANAIHVGRRIYVEGLVDPLAVAGQAQEDA
jgi:CRISPR system Cascade subunit CasD